MKTRKREKEKIQALKGRLSKGKGVDIGTAFVKCAQKEGEQIVFRSQRNAFFEIEHTDFTRNILDNSHVKYIIKDTRLYVVGDEALEFANMFSKETRRPLARGVISPREKEALPMVELLIKSVVGKPSYEGEIVYFSVPGNPVDADVNVIYHTKIIEGFLKTLGYVPKSINEGHAVILSELADEDFTGIGLSLGGGMVNVCLCFMSVPILEFSLTKAGDWIDEQVAMAVDETASRVSAIKESSLDLSKEGSLIKNISPGVVALVKLQLGLGQTQIENALSIYYNHLIEHVIENIKQEFSKARKLPRITKPIAIVLSGGSSLPKGFANRFEQILDRLKLPLPVSCVRMASQPLRAVAKGALVAASADESRK